MRMNIFRKGGDMSRVVIGRNYLTQPTWKVIIGVPLIYLPILVTVPFVIIGVILV